MSRKVTFFLFPLVYYYYGEMEKLKIYLDIVILVNFGINFLFSFLILTLFNEKASITRLMISSLCASVMVVTMIFDIIIYNFFKIFGAVFLTYIGLGTHRFVLKTSIFYLLHFALTGVVASFSIKHIYLLFGIIVVVVLIILENFRRRSINSLHLKYNISVTFNKKKFDLQGYLDTGNFVCYKNIPIIFIDKKFFQSNLGISEVVLVQTVEHLTKINIYIPDSFIIKIKNKKIKKDVYIAFTKLEVGLDCLLNYHLIF